MIYPTRIDLEAWQLLHLCGAPTSFGILRNPTTSPARRIEQINAMEAFYQGLMRQVILHDPELAARGSLTYTLIDNNRYTLPERAVDVQLVPIELYRQEYEHTLAAITLGDNDGSPKAN